MNLANAMLRQMDQFSEPSGPDGVVVPFTFNPEKITLSRTLRTKQVQGQSKTKPAAKDVVSDLGVTVIRIEGVTFYGAKTLQHCKQLLVWSEAVPKQPKPAGDANETVAIGLQLSWGRELVFDVHMETVTITYTKFAGTTGKPVRALVGLTMRQYKPETPAQNPTSGGPPGRRSHVLDSSERLQTLATANYGRPSAWRAIARANGIDDPLRVRPGRTLFLPNAEELARPGGALS